MTEDSVELVRLSYEAWNEHGPAVIRPMLAEDVELYDAPDLPDAQVWRGPDAVVNRLEAVTAAVGGGSVEFEGFAPRGDAVLVRMCWQLDSGQGDLRLGQIFHLVGVSEGMISRIRVFLTEAEAQGA
ncbi:MAG: nuclear transport factor 2 family protein [Solirubrobacterales bacterium]